MKIGFSLGRCVRDLVNGTVAFEDVLVIVTRTRIETAESLEAVIREYMWEPTYLRGLDPAECQAMALKLWDGAKFHQPRLKNVHPNRVGDDYVWMDVVPTVTDMPEHVAEAWKAYRTVLSLGAGNIPDSPKDINKLLYSL